MASPPPGFRGLFTGGGVVDLDELFMNIYMLPRMSAFGAVREEGPVEDELNELLKVYENSLEYAKSQREFRLVELVGSMREYMRVHDMYNELEDKIMGLRRKMNGGQREGEQDGQHEED